MTPRLCWQIRARVWQYTIHFDDQSLSSIFLFTTTLSCSSTDDYDQHDSCIGVKRLLTIYNKNVNKSIGPCQGIRVLEPVKFLFVESGILSFGMRNKAQRIRNATKDWNPIQRSTRKKVELGAWNQESTAWNPESKTVLDSLTWNEKQHMSKTAVYVFIICCFVPSVLSCCGYTKPFFKVEKGFYGHIFYCY